MPTRLHCYWQRNCSHKLLAIVLVIYVNFWRIHITKGSWTWIRTCPGFESPSHGPPNSAIWGAVDRTVNTVPINFGPRWKEKEKNPIFLQIKYRNQVQKHCTIWHNLIDVFFMFFNVCAVCLIKKELLYSYVQWYIQIIQKYSWYSIVY